MIENKLLHFNSRREFERKLSDIADTSIAFIDEDKTIYTHGVEYNCKNVQLQIEDIYEELDDAIHNTSNDLQQLIDELQTYITETVESNVSDTIDRIGEAESLLEEVRSQLADLESSGGDFGADINDLKTQITLFSNWYDTTQSTLSNMLAIINRIDGELTAKSSFIDTINNTLNAFQADVNTRFGRIEYSIEHIDVTEDIRTVIGREISASDGLLHDFVKTTDIDIDGNNITSVIEQWFETYDINGSNNPSWNSLVARVSNNESALATIRQKVGNDYAALTGLAQWKTNVTSSITALRQEVATGVASSEVDAIVQNYINNNSALAQLCTWATNLNSNTQSGFSLSAVLQSLTNDGGDYIADQELSAAFIEGINNNNNTSIKIHANQIQLDGTAIFNVLSGTSSEYNDVRAYTDIYENGSAVFADLDTNRRVSILPTTSAAAYALAVEGDSRFQGSGRFTDTVQAYEFNGTEANVHSLYITGNRNSPIINADENGINLYLSTRIYDLLYADVGTGRVSIQGDFSVSRTDGENNYSLSFSEGDSQEGELNFEGGLAIFNSHVNVAETLNVGGGAGTHIDEDCIRIYGIENNIPAEKITLSSLVAAVSVPTVINNTLSVVDNGVTKAGYTGDVLVNEHTAQVNGQTVTQRVYLVFVNGICTGTSTISVSPLSGDGEISNN